MSEISKGELTAREAGRRGGNVIKERYGAEFYAKIGKKGGDKVARQRGPAYFDAIGSKGDLALAMGLGIILITISITVNAGAYLLQSFARQAHG